MSLVGLLFMEHSVYSRRGLVSGALRSDLDKLSNRVPSPSLTNEDIFRRPVSAPYVLHCNQIRTIVAGTITKQQGTLKFYELLVIS